MKLRCAVLGSPVAHSLSPALHLAAYDALGLDWDYERHDVTEAALPAFLDGLDDSWRGLSLTMPLKRAVVPLLDDVTEGAVRAGAVNTLVMAGGRRTGHNTDVPGLVAALRERHAGSVMRAAVVGGGATAASALLALADLGCREATLYVREESRSRDTVATAARHSAAPRLDVRRLGSPVHPVDVLVSTVPASAQDAAVLAVAEGSAVVFEVVYDPWPTPLMTFATDTGRTLVTGLDLLVHQAVRQVELMTGVPEAPLAVMRRAGEAALAERSG